LPDLPLVYKAGRSRRRTSSIWNSAPKGAQDTPPRFHSTGLLPLTGHGGTILITESSPSALSPSPPVPLPWPRPRT
jgi:hypothetical protein